LSDKDGGQGHLPTSGGGNDARWDEATSPTGGYAGYAPPSSKEGVIFKRIIAYIIDVIILTVVSYATATLLIILTLGLAFFVIGGVIIALALWYHTFFIGRNAATPGMALIGLEVRDIMTDKPPSYGQAFVATATFYLSIVMTFWIVLLVPLFTHRNRTVHDLISGTVVVRRSS
jgi:uncharacterized RDD family membrane protein YckC